MLDPVFVEFDLLETKGQDIATSAALVLSNLLKKNLSLVSRPALWKCTKSLEYRLYKIKANTSSL